MTDLKGAEPVGVGEVNVVRVSNELSDGFVQLDDEMVVVRLGCSEMRDDILAVFCELGASMRESKGDRTGSDTPSNDPVTA